MLIVARSRVKPASHIIYNLLLINDYHPQFITEHINKIILEIRNRNNNTLDINNITERNKSVISFSYDGDLFENITASRQKFV